MLDQVSMEYSKFEEHMFDLQSYGQPLQINK